MSTADHDGDACDAAELAKMSIGSFTVFHGDDITRITLFSLVVIAFQVAAARLSLQREVKRRWQHALTGHALVLVSYYLPVPYCIAGLAISCGLMFYVRSYQSDLFLEQFGPLLRSHELEEGRLPGAFYFLVGTCLTVFLFDIKIARYAVECLSIADPIAAWAGQSIRSPEISSSASVVGSLACFAVALAIGTIMLSSEKSTVFTIIGGALACTIAEAMPVGNDNLTIPLFTAFVIYLL